MRKAVLTCRDDPSSYALMRILIAGVNYAPEVTGIAPFTTGLAEHFAQQHHEVAVATTFPFAPNWQWFKTPEHRRMRERLNDVDVWRTRIVLPKSRSTAARVVFDSSIGLSSALTALSIPRVDVAICVSPPIQIALATATVRFKTGSLVILAQDLPTRAAQAVGMLKPGLSLSAASSLERLAYELADRIVVISSAFGSYIEKLGVSPAKIALIPNWVDVVSIKPSSPDQSVRDRLGGGPEDFLVVHAGSMGAKQDLLNVVEAASLLKTDEHIKIALIGDGHERDKIANAITMGHLENIRLFPLQPQHEFARVLTSADALLINQAPNVVESVLPSKLLTYMASGRPVIAAAHQDSTTTALIRGAGCGLVVEPGRPADLAAGIRTMAAPDGWADARARMGEWGRRYVTQHFERGEILERWDKLLTSLK